MTEKLALTYKIVRERGGWLWHRYDSPHVHGKTRRLVSAVSACRRDARDRGLLDAVIALPSGRR